jgi:hypothetical protein
MTDSIKQSLDRLADMRAQMDTINLHYNELRDRLLSPELKAELDAIEAERISALDAAQEGIEHLSEAVKRLVISQGRTVRGRYLQAVWHKPRVTWETKALDGYAAAHPEIKKFRKQGQPSVSIRYLKE